MSIPGASEWKSEDPPQSHWAEGGRYYTDPNAWAKHLGAGLAIGAAIELAFPTPPEVRKWKAIFSLIALAAVVFGGWQGHRALERDQKNNELWSVCQAQVDVDYAASSVAANNAFDACSIKYGIPVIKRAF